MININAIIQNYLKKIKKKIYGSKFKPEQPETKRSIIKSYSKNLKSPQIFIETGTYKGDTVDYLKNDFQKIHSIELDKNLYSESSIRFLGLNHIKIYHGDSSMILSKIIINIQEPCLFWLDGHYSGNETAKGEKESPVLSELKNIAAHPIKNHIVLIDDARKFIGHDGYPTLKKLTKIVKNNFSDHSIEVKNDIIRISPKENDKK